MAEQSITCPSCGKKIPLTSASRAEIEASVKDEFSRQLEAELERARAEAARTAEKKASLDLAALRDELTTQAKELEQARRVELAMRKRERELERKAKELELAVERRLADERTRLVSETQVRLAEEHRLKDAEKERQLADMRRQIEDLKRRAEQGSQQAQGEAGEAELEMALRATFPMDEIVPVAQGVRGADIHQAVLDLRGLRCGAILWECKNTKHWSDGWIAKLKADQRMLRADVAVLVTSALPKGCSRFGMVEGVLVTDFACAAPLAAMVRSNLLQLAQARGAALTKDEKLELLHRYLSGVEFRQRVEAIVEAFDRMRDDLDHERRAAERLWAKRAKQIEAVTFNIAGTGRNAGSLSSALHHARRDSGAGFCTFNGLALATRAALDAGARRVLILDLDAHVGDATIDLVGDWPDVTHVDLAVSGWACAGGDPSRGSLDVIRSADDYLPTLHRRLAAIHTSSLDLCIYNAAWTCTRTAAWAASRA